MLPLSVFFMVVGYTLLWSGIKAGPNQKYARAPWQLLSDAAKNVPVTAQQIGFPLSQMAQYVSPSNPYGINPYYSSQLAQFYAQQGTPITQPVPAGGIAGSLQGVAGIYGITVA